MSNLKSPLDPDYEKSCRRAWAAERMKFLARVTVVNIVIASITVVVCLAIDRSMRSAAESPVQTEAVVEEAPAVAPSTIDPTTMPAPVELPPPEEYVINEGEEEEEPSDAGDGSAPEETSDQSTEEQKSGEDAVQTDTVSSAKQTSAEEASFNEGEEPPSAEENALAPEETPAQNVEEGRPAE